MIFIVLVEKFYAVRVVINFDSLCIFSLGMILMGIYCMLYWMTWNFFLAMYMDVLGVNGGIYAIHDWLLESGFICDHFFLLNIVFFSLTDLRFENKVFFFFLFFYQDEMYMTFK